MDDDFIEEDDNVFGEDDVFDCMMLDEMENESGKQKGSGCLTSIFITISTIGALSTIILMVSA